MLIDDVTIEAKAGRGGDGVVRFTKLMMSQGPSGGNGGHGGSTSGPMAAEIYRWLYNHHYFKESEAENKQH